MQIDHRMESGRPSPIARRTKRVNILLFIAFAISGFLLTSCILVDYVYCCTVSCAAFEASTSLLWAYYFNFINPFFQSLSEANHYVVFLSQLSAQAGIWFLIFLGSFTVARFNSRKSSLLYSLLDIFQLGTLAILLFEIGIYFLCPTWSAVHVSNLQNGTAFSSLTNEDLLYMAGAAFILCEGFRIVKLKRCKVALRLYLLRIGHGKSQNL